MPPEGTPSRVFVENYRNKKGVYSGLEGILKPFLSQMRTATTTAQKEKLIKG